jgi:GH35 family endo-1,4-beta-xylanase
MKRFFNILSDINQADYDVIGFQAHVDVTDRFRLEIIKQMLEKYSKLGKPIHITEFTPPSQNCPITKSWKTGDWTEEEQAEYATKFYKFCFSLPYVENIGWWDLCDYGSWQSYGGLLREDLNPKPAYNALKKLIHFDWHTREVSKTDESGKMKFRGFYGKYEVKVTAPDGTTKTVIIHLKRGSENKFRIRL